MGINLYKQRRSIESNERMTVADFGRSARHMRLYFAYGSNMWDTQMQQRCPESKKLGVATLKGFRWIISMRGYASVVESADDEVDGVLFQISDADEKSLDRFEGVHNGIYVKRDLPVRHANQEQRALVYIDPVTTEGNPKAEYVNRINAALRDAQLSEAYVVGHVRRFIPKEQT